MFPEDCGAVPMIHTLKGIPLGIKIPIPEAYAKNTRP